MNKVGFGILTGFALTLPAKGLELYSPHEHCQERTIGGATYYRTCEPTPRSGNEISLQLAVPEYLGEAATKGLSVRTNLAIHFPCKFTVGLEGGLRVGAQEVPFTFEGQPQTAVFTYPASGVGVASIWVKPHSAATLWPQCRMNVVRNETRYLASEVDTRKARVRQQIAAQQSVIDSWRHTADYMAALEVLTSLKSLLLNDLNTPAIASAAQVFANVEALVPTLVAKMSQCQTDGPRMAPSEVAALVALMPVIAEIASDDFWQSRQDSDEPLRLSDYLSDQDVQLITSIEARIGSYLEDPEQQIADAKEQIVGLEAELRILDLLEVDH